MIHQVSKGIASLGRNGDTMLVHMSPQEIGGLQHLAKLQGTSLTINPHTGMPEAFNLFKMFTSFLPAIAGGIVGGPMGFGAMGGLMAGAATGAGIAAAKGENALLGGLMGGMGGYGGSGLADAFKAAGASGVGNAAGTELVKDATVGATDTALANAGGGAGNLGMFSGTTADSTMAGVGDAAQFGQAGQYSQMGNVAGAAPAPDFAAISNAGSTPGTGGFTSDFQGSVDQIGSGMKNTLGLGDVKQADAWKAFTGAGGSPTQLGLLGLQGVMSGMEPPSYSPIDSKDKYDPYSQLDLSNDTGLRLYAAGGSVSGSGSYYGTQSGGNYNTYNTSDSLNNNALSRDGFGIGRLESLASQASGAKAAQAGQSQAFARGGYLDGPGDGMSDSIHATIEGQQPAKLADGEFVVPADVVSHLGNGSSKAGSHRLYSMLDKVRQARTGHKAQGKQINPSKYLPA